MAVRGSRDLSQADIARRMACSQSRVSKLENGQDFDVRIGDLVRCAAALDLEVGFTFTPRGMSIVDRIKCHAVSIKRMLDKLVRHASVDETIAKGISHFFGEAVVNLVRMVHNSAKNLPPDPDAGDPYLRISFRCEEVTEDDCDEETSMAGGVQQDAAEHAVPCQ